MAVLCLGCSAAKDSARVIKVDAPFSGISVGGNVKVDYTPSAKVSIKATGNSEALATLKAYVKGGTLYLYTDNEGRFSHLRDNKVEVVMTAPAMKDFQTHGNAGLDVLSSSGINGSLEISTSGNSGIEFHQALSCKRIEINTSGNSSVELEGATTCTTFRANTSGNSSVEAVSVTADVVNLDSSGNSEIDVRLNGAGKVDATASGNSEIKIPGTARSKNVHTSGFAEIKTND